MRDGDDGMVLEATTAAALVLGLGVAAQVIARHTRIPSIILLLAAGFAVGPVLPVLDPDALLGDLLPPLVSLGVALILFEGGLGLDARELRAHGPVVTRLVTVGLAVTWLVAAAGAHYILEWSLRDAVLVAAILVVTGPTVVLPLLAQVRARPDVDAVARWEGILIDPIGAVFAVVVFQATTAGTQGVPGFVVAIGGGAAVGFVGALLLVLSERRFLVADSLASAFALALVVAAYAAGQAVFDEAGLVAVTTMGIVLANQRKARVHHALGWRQPLSVLLLGSLFILLAARVDAADLLAVAADPRAWVFVALLVLVARPLSVAICAQGARLTLRERVFLGALAPRGIVAAAVAALFAVRLESRGEGTSLVPLVFFVVVVTVVLYGSLARPAARALGVAGPTAAGILLIGANTVTRTLAEGLGDDDVRSLILDTDMQALTAARIEGLETSYGRVHTADVADPLDLHGIGAMWAVTPHAETNALARLRFEEEFGRARVAEVPVEGAAARGMDEARLLWGVPYSTLRDRIREGWHLRRTPITERFSADDHAREHPEAVRLWIHTQKGRILPFTRGRAPKAGPGDHITALVPPEEPPKQ